MVEGLTDVPEFSDDYYHMQYLDLVFSEIAQQTEPVDYYSFKNRQLLLNCMLELNLTHDMLLPTGIYNYSPNTILEIGIGHKKRFLNTSTSVLIGFKAPTVRYIGIDKKDRSYLNKFSLPNIQIIEETTEKAFGTNPWFEDIEIDLLHIDGSHSIKDTLIDWQFAKYVKDTGIIVIHDIKAHPGPIELVKVIDRNIYRVREYFLSDPKDFGVAVIYKRENSYAPFYS